MTQKNMKRTFVRRMRFFWCVKKFGFRRKRWEKTFQKKKKEQTCKRSAERFFLVIGIGIILLLASIGIFTLVEPRSRSDLWNTFMNRCIESKWSSDMFPFCVKWIP